MLEPGTLWTPDTSGFWILQFFEFPHIRTGMHSGAWEILLMGKGAQGTQPSQHPSDSCVTVRTFSGTGNTVERLRTSMAAGESVGHSD